MSRYTLPHEFSKSPEHATLPNPAQIYGANRPGKRAARSRGGLGGGRSQLDFISSVIDDLVDS